MDHYIYSLPVILANPEVTFSINVFNIAETEAEGTRGEEAEGTEEKRQKGQEEEVERHAFIIDTPPYSVNMRHCTRRNGKCNLYS